MCTYYLHGMLLLFRSIWNKLKWQNIFLDSFFFLNWNAKTECFGLQRKTGRFQWKHFVLFDMNAISVFFVYNTKNLLIFKMKFDSECIDFIDFKEKINKWKLHIFSNLIFDNDYTREKKFLGWKLLYWLCVKGLFLNSNRISTLQMLEIW